MEEKSSNQSKHRQHGRAAFQSTRWSWIQDASAGDGQIAGDALAKLCEAYWLPIYSYARRGGYQTNDCQDLTQAFFVKLLKQNGFAKADRQRGRFRTFLLASFQNFLKSHWKKETAEKRGGLQSNLSIDFDRGESSYAVQVSDGLTPDKLFERQWVKTLLERVLTQLRTEWNQTGKREHFDVLKAFLAGKSQETTYRDATKKLGISEGAAMAAVSRMRRRYRELLCAEIAQTVAHPNDVHDEIKSMIASLG